MHNMAQHAYRTSHCHHHRHHHDHHQHQHHHGRTLLASSLLRLFGNSRKGGESLRKICINKMLMISSANTNCHLLMHNMNFSRLFIIIDSHKHIHTHTHARERTNMYLCMSTQFPIASNLTMQQDKGIIRHQKYNRDIKK